MGKPEELAWKEWKNIQQNKQQTMEEYKMEMTVEEVKKIEDGKHTGKIVELQLREKPFRYLDLIIELPNGMRIKYGLPAALTVESKLGKLALDFGAAMETGKPLELDDVFVGKGCSFMTLSKDTERGTFANVVHGSLKPVE